MARNELKVARIGNSRGVRLPAATLERYRIGDSVVMEERPEGILLRPHGARIAKLSWEETARAMAADAEDWSDMDRLAADGLDSIPWDERLARRVAERAPDYRAGSKRSPKKRSR